MLCHVLEVSSVHKTSYQLCFLFKVTIEFQLVSQPRFITGCTISSSGHVAPAHFSPSLSHFQCYITKRSIFLCYTTRRSICSHSNINNKAFRREVIGAFSAEALQKAQDKRYLPTPAVLAMIVVLAAFDRHLGYNMRKTLSVLL